MPGFDQARLQQLLAYLVLNGANPLSREQLAFLFWPDTTDHQARKNLRTLLTRLRRALPQPDDFIATTTMTVQWRSDAPLVLDVSEFEAALGLAAAATAQGDREVAVRALVAAVKLYSGELLPDCYDDWVLPLRERLHRSYAEALEQLAGALEMQRDYCTALTYAQRLLHLDPLHEAAYGHLMRLHLALGERADALRTYASCEEMLRREFGTLPGQTMCELRDRVLSQEEWHAPQGANRAQRDGPADPPLVGRRHEWEALISAWQVSTAGQPHMVLLTGEAGIGKTRLADELVDWASRQGATVATAHCVAAGSGAALAYEPVAEWLRSASLERRVEGLDDAGRVEVSRILPALLAARPHLAPPGPLSEAWQRTRLFEALARTVLGAGPERRRPLLLFLDDLQWVDRETLAWIGYLLRFDASARLLVVATLRPYELGRDHPVVAFRLAHLRTGRLSEIELSPMDEGATAELASAVADRRVDPEEAARIYRDTEGNPLFVVEMVRGGLSFGGQEAEGPEPGAGDRPVTARRPAPRGATVMPEKVRAVIQWRLGMLSPATRRLAQTAAVIGREFGLEVLCRASELDEATVGEGLDELWQRRLVRGQRAGVYDFSHDGIRAVAVEEIGPARRRGLHLRVARALQALHADDLDAFSGQIAQHYEQAGRAELSIRFYRRAAEAAQRIYAHAEAVDLYRKLLEGGLQASLTTRERCEIRLELARIWRMTGRWAQARSISEEALAAAEAAADVPLAARARIGLADVLRLQGYYDAALEALTRSEQEFEAAGEGRGVVSALWTAGQIHWFRGDHPQALAALERQLAIATERDDQRGIGEALETMGMVYWSQGDWERAGDCCLRAIRIAQPLAHKEILTRASITLGNVRSAEHWFGEAVYWYRHAGVLAREIDARQALSWAISNIALLLAKRGDYPRALAGYERSLRNAWEIGDRWTACLNVAGLAAVNERLGRWEQAEALYRKATGFGERLSMPSYLSGMLVGLARLLLAQGRAAEARRFYGEAVATIAGVAGARVAGEDTRFDALLLDIRLRRALAEITPAQAAAELAAHLLREAAPRRQAALQYELARLLPEEYEARTAAARFYRAEHEETGAEEYRERYRELTGDVLPVPPPLPDISDLIPDQPQSLDLAPLLDEIEASFDTVL